MVESKGSQPAEDVMKLLDSLDSEDTGTTPPAKASGLKPTGNKDDDEDIMGFLDSLAKSGNLTPSASPAPKDVKEVKKEEKETRVEEKETRVEEKREEEKKNEEPASEPVDSSPSDVPKLGPESIPDPLASLSSWWSRNKGGIWDSATSAVKQAEAKVRELQPKDVAETQRSAIESIGGSISKLGLNDKTRNLLQSTFSTVLETIAPPISRHEQLQIHVFHDMIGYPAVDTIVYNVFDRVMQQVEGGGDLAMVVQKGKERHRRGSDITEQKHELGIFKGTVQQAQKLAAANIEEIIRSVTNKDKGKQPDRTGKVQATQQVGQNVAEDAESAPNAPRIRISDIYLAIQPLSSDTGESHVISPSSSSTFSFLIHLVDPEHDISFTTVSQAFPIQWAVWLDSSDSTIQQDFGADPREWVVDWVEEGLGLSVGIVAQSYVAKRMGVGEEQAKS